MYFLMFYGAGALTTAMFVGISYQFKKYRSRRNILKNDLRDHFRRMLQDDSGRFVLDEKSVYELSQKYRKSVLAIEDSPRRKVSEVAEKELVELEKEFEKALKYGELSHQEYISQKFTECKNKYEDLKRQYDPQYYKGIPEKIYRMPDPNLNDFDLDDEVYIENVIHDIQLLLDPMNLVFEKTAAFRASVREFYDYISDSMLDKIENDLSLIEVETSWGRNPEKEIDKRLRKIAIKHTPRLIFNSTTGLRL